MQTPIPCTSNKLLRVTSEYLLVQPSSVRAASHTASIFWRFYTPKELPMRLLYYGATKTGSKACLRHLTASPHPFIVARRSRSMIPFATNMGSSLFFSWKTVKRILCSAPYRVVSDLSFRCSNMGTGVECVRGKPMTLEGTSLCAFVERTCFRSILPLAPCYPLQERPSPVEPAHPLRMVSGATGAMIVGRIQTSLAHAPQPSARHCPLNWRGTHYSFFFNAGCEPTTAAPSPALARGFLTRVL
jgi:hypothetical protein